MREKDLKFDRRKHCLYPKKAKKLIREYLCREFGKDRAEELWEKIRLKYVEYVNDYPDVGGKKNNHAAAIYGSLFVFAFCETAVPDKGIEELQPLIYKIFMEDSFRMLGRVFDLNKRSHMRLADWVFQKAGEKDRRLAKRYPAGFINVTEPFDEEHQAVRYHFTQCPVAEFAKKRGLKKWMPLFCNCDYLAMRELGCELIRHSTCTNGDKCDYYMVGSRNPVIKEHPLKMDKDGLWYNEAYGGDHHI